MQEKEFTSSFSNEKVDAELATPSPVSFKKKVPKNRGSKRKYLIVDDVLTNCKLLGKKLSPHLCVFASDGQEAVQQFRKAVDEDIWLDMIFMDLEMPGMDKIEATSQIRQQPLGAQTPIIYVSGKVETQTEFAALNSKMNSFLPKKAPKKQLLSCIKKYSGVGFNTKKISIPDKKDSSLFTGESTFFKRPENFIMDLSWIK